MKSVAFAKRKLFLLVFTVLHSFRHPRFLALLLVTFPAVGLALSTAKIRLLAPQAEEDCPRHPAKQTLSNLLIRVDPPPLGQRRPKRESRQDRAAR